MMLRITQQTSVCSPRGDTKLTLEVLKNRGDVAPGDMVMDTVGRVGIGDLGGSL